MLQLSTTIFDLSDVDRAPSNAKFSRIDAMLYILRIFESDNNQSANREALLNVFEDNEAVIKMIISGRSPTMRHVSRTHRVALDWLFDRINLDTEIQIRYIDTKNQLADIDIGEFHTWWVEQSSPSVVQ